ncbi:probable ATP-dependent RNA helicase DDX27 [Macrosteles quadrilineatus]|uniref:probable ATP-dependent RNA helicase DDX27 n=1 Tax=Macrosteles quadrilineatus TaxID=74068 RepID=UPI0023E16391|nr:probable ATP-dependent RNA helicase DDX27 [Macrosteles quadrilineatus]
MTKSTKKLTSFDLIPTIKDSEEIPNYSEDSDVEEEFQPSRQKNKKKKDFDPDFHFAGSTSEYNKDVWNDLTKYIKRKAKSKVDDKILKARKKLKSEGHSGGEDSESDVEIKEEPQSNDELSLSEDELKRDDIKLKEKKIGKKKLKKMKLMENDDKSEKQEDFFEDAPPFDLNASFYQMNLSRPLLKSIGSMNFTTPTPIQAATIPVALSGRDICGCAATGTGKTAAYMLPSLERLLYRPRDGTAVTRVLVLVPTRELGVQVYQVTRQLAQFTNIEVGLAVGGLDLKTQESVLRRSPDIVIATPGRLIDHLKNTPSFSLDSVEILILDEADRMLDEYFQEQMTEIIKQCARSRQTLLFSATMTDAVNDLATVSLNKPVKVFVDNNQDVAFNLRQEFVKIRKEKEADREALLAALVCRTFHNHTMVFVTTKKQAHRIHILLGLLGVKVGELHGNLTQPQRLEALRRFKDEEVDILVATDVAARGLDIRGVKTVINFMLPSTLEHYIHRVGRTARAGRAGVSVSLAGENERKLVKQIVKRARHPVKSRVIPSEIVDKYRKKVSKLEDEINKILHEEWEERVMQRTENQANRAEKILQGGGTAADMPRTWFQTHKQREEEKERLRLTEGKKEPGKKQKDTKSDKNEEKAPNEVPEGPRERKKKKKHVDTPEERVNKEMEKVMLLQARLAKQKRKTKKLRAVVDSTYSGPQGAKKRKQSSFEHDLTDTSKNKVKRLRYEANSHSKQEKFGKKNQKFQKGKGFSNKTTFKKKK